MPLATSLAPCSPMSISRWLASPCGPYVAFRIVEPQRWATLYSHAQIMPTPFWKLLAITTPNRCRRHHRSNRNLIFGDETSCFCASHIPLLRHMLECSTMMQVSQQDSPQSGQYETGPAEMFAWARRITSHPTGSPPGTLSSPTARLESRCVWHL